LLKSANLRKIHNFSLQRLTHISRKPPLQKHENTRFLTQFFSFFGCISSEASPECTEEADECF